MNMTTWKVTRELLSFLSHDDCLSAAIKLEVISPVPVMSKTVSSMLQKSYHQVSAFSADRLTIRRKPPFTRHPPSQDSTLRFISIFATERSVAKQALEEYDTNTPPVASSVILAALYNLWSHVLTGPNNTASQFSIAAASTMLFSLLHGTDDGVHGTSQSWQRHRSSKLVLCCCFPIFLIATYLDMHFLKQRRAMVVVVCLRMSPMTVEGEAEV